MEPEIPAPTAPLGPETSDMDVIEGKDQEEAPLLSDSDEAKTLLNICMEYDRREEFVRISAVREYRKHMLYWDGFQYLAWDSFTNDWKTPEELAKDDPQADIDPSLYAKVVNVYKAHGEILIGALSAGTPRVRFFPKDADEQEDVMSAKAHTKIAELIQKHNRAQLLLMKSLFVMYNQGLVAAYNENKSDTRFGVVDVPEYGDVEMTNRSHYCPSCGHEFGSESFQSVPPPDPNMPPEQAMMQPQAPPPMSEQPCPGCGAPVEPMPEDSTSVEQQQIGTKKEPKNRECIEIYGPLNVKIPYWVRDQISTPYLILETEEHVGMLREIYEEIADKIQGIDFPDAYERESRIPSAYKQDYPRDLCTVQRIWLRPWALNLVAGDKDAALAIKAKYPDGVYIVIINRNIVAEILEDKLDDHWTLSEHPLSETLHVRPLGAGMVPMQDVTNELFNLTLETIEFGLPEMYADSRVIDFDAYSRQEARPGMVTPAVAPAGRSLGEGFYESKAANLSKEVEPFADRVHTMSQFIMGSYPSIYGGSLDGGSGTAKEYEMSKASALQRLSTTWTILQEWWCKVIQKSTKSFVKNMKGDESFVQSKGSSFLNIWIKRDELTGEVGDVEPEISETFPVSWSQKRDVILNLIQLKDPDISAVIRHPENAGLIASIIGVPELFIPGDDSRDKQLYEIAKLLRAEPIEGMAGLDGQPGQLQSSVPVDPILDDNEVEVEICKSWLRSPIGLDAKENNPAGYANVLAHMKEHDMFVQQALAAQSGDSQNSDSKDKMEEVNA